MSDQPVKYACPPVFSVELEALPASLPNLVDGIIPIIASIGWSHADLNRIELVVEEAMLNVALHGYEGKGGWLKVVIEAGDDASLRLTIEDSAPRFNPLEMPSPDCSLAIEDRNIGGLGVHLVRNMSDAAFYSYRDGHNVMQLIFRPRS